MGAVLSQGPIGTDKTVAYASRTLSDTEARYSTIERECLAIIWAIKHFRPYLYGRKFAIYMDLKPLSWLNSLKDASSKLTRWRLRLQDYDYEIIYKKGKQNSNADALSRIKVNGTHSDDEDQSMKVNVDDRELRLRQHLDDSSATISISDSETISVPSSVKTSDYPIRSPSVTSRSDTVHSAVDIESSGIPTLKEAVETKPNQILVYAWLRNATQVKDISHSKQKILNAFLPTNTQI